MEQQGWSACRPEIGQSKDVTLAKGLFVDVLRCCSKTNRHGTSLKVQQTMIQNLDQKQFYQAVHFLKKKYQNQNLQINLTISKI